MIRSEQLEALGPCPRCNYRPALFYTEDPDKTGVFCMKCRIETKPYRLVEDAIEDWNRDWND